MGELPDDLVKVGPHGLGLPPHHTLRHADLLVQGRTQSRGAEGGSQEETPLRGLTLPASCWSLRLRMLTCWLSLPWERIESLLIMARVWSLRACWERLSSEETAVRVWIRTQACGCESGCGWSYIVSFHLRPHG